MPRPAFKRPLHRVVAAHLERLDDAFLEECRCYFGGGTRIVLELGEYRESRDIDFLCADRAGYRRLRETISDASLGAIAKPGVELARAVRADNYGIRTRLGSGADSFKFEIVREARIDLTGERVRRLAPSCLDRTSAFAEKFLANADRGLDASTLSRDAIDLAFMLQGWDGADAVAGLEIARSAYGAEVGRKATQVAQWLRRDRAYLARCVAAMEIADTSTLRKGLEQLARIVAEPQSPPARRK